MRKGFVLLPAIIVVLAVTAFGALLWMSLSVPAKITSTVSTGSTIIVNSQVANINTSVNPTVAIDVKAPMNAISVTNSNSSDNTVATVNSEVLTNTTAGLKATTEGLANSNAVLENDKSPIKKVTNLRSIMPVRGDGGFSGVSVMGTKAIMAGSGLRMYFYDGKDVTDESHIITSADPSATGIGGVYAAANNGSYWLVAFKRAGSSVNQPDHLYSFDGTKWKDLTNDLHQSIGGTDTGFIGTMTWNGTYWLMTYQPGHIIKYDGTTFTDTTSLPTEFNSPLGISSVAWNGEYFLLTKFTSGNHGAVYRYDGTTIVALTGIDPNNYINRVAWNGTYWLLAGFNNQHILKYDGTTITDTGVGTRDNAALAWVGSTWLISQYLFDGTTLDTTSLFDPIGLPVYKISVGTKYGLLTDQGGNIYRFDL